MSTASASEDQPTATAARIGRPPKYETPEEMQVAIDDYFEECDRAKRGGCAFLDRSVRWSPPTRRTT